jgi:hypothetical protein
LRFGPRGVAGLLDQRSRLARRCQFLIIEHTFDYATVY